VTDAEIDALAAQLDAFTCAAPALTREELAALATHGCMAQAIIRRPLSPIDRIDFCLWERSLALDEERARVAKISKGMQ
jgi:hypothetical protein